MSKIRFLFTISVGLFLLIGTQGGFTQPFSKEYTVNKVTGTPPVMDGKYTEAEWAGSVWTGEFYGLNNQSSNGANQGEIISLNYRWRALWDQDYFYILYEAETFDLPINGIIADNIVAPVENDNDVYSYNTGESTDLEIFLEPNWKAGDGFNSDPPDYTDPGADQTDGYHFTWFVLENDETYTQKNEGVRDSKNLLGPPWFAYGAAYNDTYVGGTWTPTFDPAAAATLNAKPFLAAALLNLTGKERGSGEVYAKPVLEIAFPFSQFNTNFGIAEQGADETETNLNVTKDASGNYVNPGDEWLINVCGYTDPFTAAGGLTLITWNNVIGGPFASYPRGILKFAAGTGVSDWMLQ